MKHNFAVGTKIRSVGGARYEVAPELIRKHYWPTDTIPVRTDSGAEMWLWPEEVAEVVSTPLTLKLPTLTFGWPTLPNTAWNEGILELAIDQARRVTFDYAHVDGDAAAKRRVVQPEQIFTSNAGHRVLVAYDEDADDIRAFRIDHITSGVEPA